VHPDGCLFDHVDHHVAARIRLDDEVLCVQLIVQADGFLAPMRRRALAGTFRFFSRKRQRLRTIGPKDPSFGLGERRTPTRWRRRAQTGPVVHEHVADVC
jgi:hypothetical protein